MIIYFYVFIGGGAGALCRLLLSSLLSSGIEPGKIPTGVLTCNILGCFLIGLVYASTKENAPVWLSPLVVTGFLGGFTTFSSFGLETIKMIQLNAFLPAFIYVTASVLGGLAAIILAIKIIR